MEIINYDVYLYLINEHNRMSISEKIKHKIIGKYIANIFL